MPPLGRLQPVTRRTELDSARHFLPAQVCAITNHVGLARAAIATVGGSVQGIAAAKSGSPLV